MRGPHLWSLVCVSPRRVAGGVRRKRGMTGRRPRGFGQGAGVRQSHGQLRTAVLSTKTPFLARSDGKDGGMTASTYPQRPSDDDVFEPPADSEAVADLVRRLRDASLVEACTPGPAAP